MTFPHGTLKFALLGFARDTFIVLVAPHFLIHGLPLPRPRNEISTHPRAEGLVIYLGQSRLRDVFLQSQYLRDQHHPQLPTWVSRVPNAIRILIYWRLIILPRKVQLPVA